MHVQGKWAQTSIIVDHSTEGKLATRAEGFRGRTNGATEQAHTMLAPTLHHARCMCLGTC